MQNTFHINVDLKKKTYIEEPVVTQNDRVTFIISVSDDGSPFPLQSVATATLAHKRLDCVIVVTQGTVTGTNTVEFTLGTEETKIPGRVEATVQLYDSDGRVSTLSFVYQVLKDPTGNGYIPTERERTLIEIVLGDGPLVIQQAQDAANFANEQGQFAQEQASAASEAATRANEAAQFAMDAATNANDAAANANEAADNATTQAQYAQQQGDYAKAQGDYAKQVGDENKTRWLTAVNTYADIATTYPNPQLGDTVQTIDDSKIYRWDGTQWVWTQQYNANAITDVQNKIGILSNEKADKSYVDTKIANILDGSPKGVYATLTDLQAAYPTGTEGVYVVVEDGKWYYWNGSAWTAGGQYQSAGIADKSITSEKLNLVRKGTLVGGQPTIIDYALKKIIFNGFVVVENKYFSANQSIVENISLESGIHYIVFNKSTLLFSVVHYPNASTLTDDDIVIGGYWATGSAITQVSCDFPYELRNNGTVVAKNPGNPDKREQKGYVVTDSFVNFDFINRIITFPADTFIIYKNEMYRPSNKTITMTSTTDSSVAFLFFNIKTLTLGAIYYSENRSVIDSDCIILGTFWPSKKTVSVDFPYTINGEKPWTSDINSVKVKEGFIYNADIGLRKWRAALANMKVKNDVILDVPFIGDSITEGQSASDYRLGGYVGRIRSALAEKYGDVGLGFVPVYYPGNAPLWSFSGNWIDNTGGYGPSGISKRSTTNGDTATLAFNGTGITVMGLQGPGVADISVSIDGGMPTTLNFKGSTIKPVFRSITGLADGNHIMTITTNVAPGESFWLIGAYPIKGTKGIRVHPMAKQGARTHNVNTDQAMQAEIDVWDPKLTVIAIGTNDIPAGLSADNYGAQLQTLVTRAKRYGDVLLVSVGLIRTDYDDIANLYNETMKNIALTNNVAFIDIRDRWGGSADYAMNTLGFLYDPVHPNDVGHQDIATAILRVIDEY